MTDRLRAAAQALVDRWDTPLWKDTPHTGKYINELRAALAEPENGGGLYLTIVYKDVQPGPETSALAKNPKVSAVSWSHAIDDRNAARAALAEQDHLRDATKMIGEPVAWGIIASNTGRICRVELDAEEIGEYKPEHVVPLYTAPPRREWQGLTDEEIADIVLNCYAANGAEFDDFKIARAIEAKLKERNHD